MANWAIELFRLRKDLVTEVEKRFTQLFGWTIGAVGGTVGGDDAAETSDDDVDPTSHQKGQRPATRVEPWGFRGIPPKGVRRFWVSWGRQGSKTVSLGVEVSQGYGPQDLAAGESAQYCAVQGVVIKEDKDGNVVIRCAPGKLVTVDDGSGAVALALKSDVTAIKNWLNAHVHTGGTGGGGLTGVPSPADAPAPSGTTVLQGK